MIPIGRPYKIHWFSSSYNAYVIQNILHDYLKNLTSLEGISSIRCKYQKRNKKKSQHILNKSRNETPFFIKKKEEGKLIIIAIQSGLFSLCLVDTLLIFSSSFYKNSISVVVKGALNLEINWHLWINSPHTIP